MKSEGYAGRWTRWMEDERRRVDGDAGEARWIPVETPPPAGEKVLVCGSGSMIGKFVVVAIYGVDPWDRPRMGWRFPLVEVALRGHVRRGMTHWMPLPEGAE